MQAPTHFLFGIIIADVIPILFPNLPNWGHILIIFLLAFSNHFFIDAFAKFTYHPPNPDWKDKVWVSYHAGIYILSLLILIFFWMEYWWVMIVAILVDIIDWVILRAILKKNPIFHPISDRIRSVLFSKVKDLTYMKWAIVLELVLILILGVFVWLIKLI